MEKLIYSLLLLLWTTSIQAQEYMTLQKARELALAKSEDLKIAHAKLAQSEHEQKAVRTTYFPSVSASATGIYLDDKIAEEYYLPTYTLNSSTGQLEPNVAVNPSTGETLVGSDGNPLFNLYAYLPLELSLHGAYQAGIRVEQPVYTGGKISSGNRMADLGVAMADQNLEVQRMKTVAEADQAYWLYVSVQSKVRLAKTNLTMLGALLKRVQDSYEVGLIKRNDVLKVQVEYDKARLDLQKAGSGLELSRMSLCRVTGLSFDTAIQTDSVIVTDESLLRKLGNEDVTGRPEYQILDKSVELEQARMNAVRSDYLPTVGVSAGYNYWGRVEFNGSDFNQGNFNVMAQVKIPLFSWGEGRQKVAVAKEDRNMKRQELEKNRQLMQLEIENAKLNLNDAALRIKISEDALIQASENLRVSRDNFEVGRELMSDLLTAQTQWVYASNEVLEAKTNYRLQETEYLRVTAQLLP